MPNSYENLLEAVLILNGAVKIAEIPTDDLFTESITLDKDIRGTGNVRILVHSAEGPNPHCYVIHKDFRTCIRLDTADYFLHRSFTDKLNKKWRDAFITFMTMKTIKVAGDIDVDNDNETVWETCCKEWNRTVVPPKIRIDISAGMPDYSELLKK